MSTVNRLAVRPNPAQKSGGYFRAVMRRSTTSCSIGVIGLLLAIILIRVSGYEPVSALSAAFQYALGSVPHAADTVSNGLPLMLAALGVGVAFRSGMFNIGAQGQLFLGALVAAIAGAYMGPFFSPAHIAICFVFAAAVGGLAALALGWLRTKLGVDEVLSTLLANYIIILFATYLVNGPLHDPTRQNGTTRTVHTTAMFPTLVNGSQLTTGLFLVVGLTAATYWIGQHSIVGYRWRMVGLNDNFAEAVGIRVTGHRLAAMTMSGALCGCAGALLVTTSQGRFWTGIDGGIGWDSVLIALVAGARPASIIIWSLVYSIMGSGAIGMEQAAGIPAEFSEVIIALIIIAAAARSGSVSILSNWIRSFQKTPLSGLARRAAVKEV